MRCSPRARRDLVAALRWIAKDSPAAARALSDAVTKAARLIGDRSGRRAPLSPMSVIAS